jgi:hypothetical protein
VQVCNASYPACLLANTSTDTFAGRFADKRVLGCAIGETGARVLVVDLDGSAFVLTRAFGLAPSQAPATTFEVMTGQAGALATRL